MRLVASFLTLFVFLAPAQEPYTRSAAPEVFSYDELLRLADDPLPEDLAAKLEALTTTPFINNEAHYRGAKPHKPEIDGLGSSMRVVMWNIARGINLEEIMEAFTDAEAFLRRQGSTQERIDASELLAELETLETADVLVLNEVDWGMRRSEYREIVRELGEALNMNWAYAVEFIEIDPKSLGTEKFEEVEDLTDRREMVEAIQVEPEKLRALHGTAILSRYPIAEARIAPFSKIGYDWYQSEKERVSKLEGGKRLVAEQVFLENVSREIRRGGRTVLFATLDVPDLPEGKLTVAAPHLENRTDPENRVEQMREALAELKEVRNPVVIAGDLNTTFSDTSPTSIKREVFRTLGSSEFWATKGIKYATGLGLAFDVVSGGVNMIKNHSDPTVKDVPIVAPNPEYDLFKMLEEFRFRDGTTLDFRGDGQRTINQTEGTLANSNQRDSKGFAITYSVARSVGTTGKLRLDWIFVKAYAEDPRNTKHPYRFAPHYARTMSTLNYALGERLSDHDPISVELPFEEPGKLKPKKKGGGFWPFGR